MKAQLSLRLSASIIAISLFPLAAGLVTAWAVHHSQKDIGDSLAINVRSMRAAEEVAIGIRDIRMLLDRFQMTGDRKHLDGIPAIQKETDRWLIEAEKTAVVPRELELIGQLKKDYHRFFGEFQEVFRLPPGEELTRRVKELDCESLDKEILTPAQEFLDFNEEEIAKNSDDNQKMSDKTMVGLSLLGICGPLAGLLAGYGIARGINRSIVRLSVPIRDAAGRLNEIAGPINFSAAWGLEDLEEILHKMANQIEAVITRLQESQRAALRAEQLAAVGQMAAGIAHEVRNPLMSMKLLVQAASVHEHTASLNGRDLAVLEEEITRLERSIQTLLDFARPPQLELRSFEARILVRQIVDLVRSRAEQQGIFLICDLPKEPVFLQADKGQMHQVVLNLILNGLDAVPENGTIWIHLAEESRNRRGDNECVDKWTSLTVEDTGCGLPAELDKCQVFEPFVSTKQTGIGLGLSICKRIIDEHGGEITAENRREGGAIFRVRLPSQTRDKSIGFVGFEPALVA